MNNSNELLIKAQKRKLAKHLELLGKGKIKPKNKKLGLCAEVEVFCYRILKLSTRDALSYKRRTLTLMSYWPKSTDNRNFPVPHPTYSSGIAYISVGSLWDRRTTYGKNRAELCLWLAEQIRKEVR